LFKEEISKPFNQEDLSIHIWHKLY